MTKSVFQSLRGVQNLVLHERTLLTLSNSSARRSISYGEVHNKEKAEASRLLKKRRILLVIRVRIPRFSSDQMLKTEVIE